LFVPVALVVLVAVLTVALVAIVAYKYWHDRNARGGWRIGAAGRYQRVVEMGDASSVLGAAAAAAAAAAVGAGRDGAVGAGTGGGGGSAGYQSRGVA